MEELKENIQDRIEMNGKINYVREDCVEKSIKNEEILAVLKEYDFDGYLICEYEDEM